MNFTNVSKRLLNKLPAEAEIELPTARQTNEQLKEWATNPVTGAFERRAHIPVEAQTENVAALRRMGGEEAILQKEINRVLGKASDDDYAQFKTLVEQEQHADDGYGAWTEPNDLALMPISTKAKEIHQIWRDVNDLDYLTTDSRLRETMKQEDYSGSDYGLITKQIDPGIVNTTSFSGMEIYVPDQKKYINSRTHSGKDIKEEFINKGYDLYEVHPYSRANEELNYGYILSKDSTKFNKPLPDMILHYAEAGVREYENGSYFVKTGRLVYGNGKIYNGTPKTLISGDDPIKLQKYADEVAEALNIYKRNRGSVPDMQKELETADFQYFKVDSANDLKNMIRSAENPKGIIDPNFTPGVYKSGEKPLNTSGYPDLHSSSTFDTARVELAKLNDRYYKGRGKILANINSDQSVLEDPRVIMEKAVQRIAYTRNIDKLMDKYGEYFKNNFADVVDTSQGLDPLAVSGRYMLTHAELKPLSEVAYRDRWKVRSAAHIQHLTNSIMGTPTKADKQIIQYWNNVIDTLEQISPEWWNASVMEKLKNKNPLRVAQSVVFQAYLGLANAAMLFKQPLQIANMAAIYQTETGKAVASLPMVLTAYMLRGEGLPFNAVMRTLNGKLSMMTPDEMEDFIRYMEQYGTFHQINKRPELVGTNLYLKSLKGFQKANMMFFEIGNDISYIVGDLVAYQLSETKSYKDIARIADDLNFNMSSANVSPAQRNPLGAILFELLSYPMGVLSALTGKQFTKGESAMLLAGMLAMWGVSGTFDKDGQPVLFDYLNQHTSLTPDQISFALDGILTHMAALYGYDIREGADLASIFRPLWDAVSVILDRGSDAPSLPIGGIMPLTVDTYKTIKDFLNPDTDGNDLLYWLRTINQRSGLPTSVRNYSKTMYAFSERKILDKYGNVIKDNLSNMDITLTAFGIHPIEERQLNSARALEKHYREAIDDYIEANVKPVINKYAEYDQTNQRYSVEEWLELQVSVRNTIAAGKAWIEQENREELTKYYNNKILNMMNSGGNAEDRLNKVQRAMFNHLTRR